MSATPTPPALSRGVVHQFYEPRIGGVPWSGEIAGITPLDDSGPD